MTKLTYIQTSKHAMIGRNAGVDTSTRLEPGQRVLLDEDDTTHAYIKKMIEAHDPSVAHLSLVEVDPEAEAKAEEEREEQLAKAEEIAAKARDEQLQAEQDKMLEQRELQDQAREEGQPTATSETDFPPQDEEAIKLAEQSGSGQRASTQDDAVDEESAPKRKPAARRSGRS